MSSYWKSLPKYYCKYCNHWCVDNKINRQNHDNSQQHKDNMDRFLMNQKVSKERQLSKEKEVARVIRKAEEEARQVMENNHELPLKNGQPQAGSKRISNSKKNAYYYDTPPPIRIYNYDTIDNYNGYPMQANMHYSESQPIIYDESNGNIPPPPPPSSYQSSKNEYIPPPPPVRYGIDSSYVDPNILLRNRQNQEKEEEEEVEKEEVAEVLPTVKYNFNYESTQTEEDLFGSWKTVSVTKLTEDDLKDRELSYEHALFKCDKSKNVKGPSSKNDLNKERQESDEDEDEKDAFELYNPFGGGYKGIEISGDEPMYIPKGNQAREKKYEESVEQKTEEKEIDKAPPQFISTPIAFSFQPQKQESKVDSKLKPSVSSFFS